MEKSTEATFWGVRFRRTFPQNGESNGEGHGRGNGNWGYMGSFREYELKPAYHHVGLQYNEEFGLLVQPLQCRGHLTSSPERQTTL